MSNVKMRSIQNETPAAPKRKSLLLPVAGGIVALGLLFWTATHLAGNCTDTLQDVFTFCPIK